MPPPQPQCLSGSADFRNENDLAPSTSSEQTLSLAKAKNLDDHVPSLKRKRIGRFGSSQMHFVVVALRQTEEKRKGGARG